MPVPGPASLPEYNPVTELPDVPIKVSLRLAISQLLILRVSHLNPRPFSEG